MNITEAPTAESFGRRAAKNGDEVDYLSYGDHDVHNTARPTVRRIARRRDRRGTRQALRNYRNEG